MRTIGDIRIFKRKNFTVLVRAVEDQDVDLSFDDTGEVARKIDSGEFQCFGVITTLLFRGAEIAEDSLWGCIYEEPKAFMDHLGLSAKARKDGRNYGSYFADMIRTVIKEGRKAIADLQTVKIRTI